MWNFFRKSRPAEPRRAAKAKPPEPSREIAHVDDDPSIDYAERYWKKRARLARPTRVMVLTEGDPGPIRATKIAGVPWWPRGVPRPICPHGHAMAFCAQVLLSDVPSLCTLSDALLSLHYCGQCAIEVGMSFGHFGENPRGCDVSIFEEIDQLEPDGHGEMTEPMIDVYSVSFEDCLEVPTDEDIGEWPDEAVFELPEPRLVVDGEKLASTRNIDDCKVGGWPGWAQDVEYPPVEAPDRLHFVAQLDYRLCDRAAWGGGGYTYLFARFSANAPPVGFMVLQDT